MTAKFIGKYCKFCGKKIVTGLSEVAIDSISTRLCLYDHFILLWQAKNRAIHAFCFDKAKVVVERGFVELGMKRERERFYTLAVFFANENFDAKDQFAKAALGGGENKLIRYYRTTAKMNAFAEHGDNPRPREQLCITADDLFIRVILFTATQTRNSISD